MIEEDVNTLDKLQDLLGDMQTRYPSEELQTMFRRLIAAVGYATMTLEGLLEEDENNEETNPQ